MFVFKHLPRFNKWSLNKPINEKGNCHGQNKFPCTNFKCLKNKGLGSLELAFVHSCHIWSAERCHGNEQLCVDMEEIHRIADCGNGNPDERREDFVWEPNRVVPLKIIDRWQSHQVHLVCNTCSEDLS